MNDKTEAKGKSIKINKNIHVHLHVHAIIPNYSNFHYVSISKYIDIQNKLLVNGLTVIKISISILEKCLRTVHSEHNECILHVVMTKMLRNAIYVCKKAVLTHSPNPISITVYFPHKDFSIVFSF